MPGMPAGSTSMSSIGLFGAATALTGSGIFLSFLALHSLSRAEGAGNPDEEARPTTPQPPMQITPMQIEETPWSASPTDPHSSSPSAPPVDADGLRLRRRSHARALRGLRCWLRVQGYRPPVQPRRPMITLSCRHARPVRSGMVGFEEPFGLPGQGAPKGPSSPGQEEWPPSPGRQEFADGSTSEPGPVAPS